MAQATTSSRSPRLDQQGRIVIPAEIREKLGFEPGVRLTMVVEGNSLRIMTWLQGLREVQEMVKSRTQGRSLVDELLAERRAEAERE